MLRPGSLYHIFNRGNNRETIFKEDAAYVDFLNRCQRYILPVAQIHAWCLLPNHFHFLAKIYTEEEQYERFCAKQNKTEFTKPFRILNPSRGFANTFGTFAMDVNRKFDRTGSLFQDRFRRKEVVTDPYLRHLIHYIHLNPVKHRLVPDAMDYPWSSLSSYIKGSSEDYLDSHVLYAFNNSDEYLRDFKQLNVMGMTSAAPQVVQTLP